MDDGARKWGAEQKQLLRRLYDGGVRIAEIVAELNQQFGANFTPAAVRSLAVKLGMRRETRSAIVWTDDRQAELEKYIKRGLSYSAIADVMEITRDAVGGQVRKLGLNQSAEDMQRDRLIAQAIREHRKDGERYARRMSELMNWVPGKYRQEAPVPIFCSVVDDPLNLSMAEVGAGQCRYIMNDDATDPKFCGHSTTRKSWCARHAEVVLV